MVCESVRGRDRSFVVMLFGVILALVAVMPFAGSVGAQDATPEAEGLGLDLPEVQITASESTFSVSGSAIVEGWTIITLTNESEAPAVANLAQLPEEQTVGDLTTVLSQSFAGEGGELPDWWADAAFAGGAWADAGATTQAVVYFTPGKWALFSTNPAAVQPAQTISVLTPEEAFDAYGIESEATPVPGDGATPVGDGATPVVEGLPADGEISIVDGGIETASAPVSGQQLWQVTNNGSQVSEVVVYAVDEEVDDDGAAELAATVAGGETPDGATLVLGSGALSAGTTSYVSANLEAGSYVAFSTQPDTAGGIQAANGVVLVFSVE